MEIVPEIKTDNEAYAILVHRCFLFGNLETFLFPDLDMAFSYCKIRWKTPDIIDWDYTENICQYRIHEARFIEIHITKMIVEF